MCFEVKLHLMFSLWPQVCYIHQSSVSLQEFINECVRDLYNFRILNGSEHKAQYFSDVVSQDSHFFPYFSIKWQ